MKPELPDFQKAFEFENQYHLTSPPLRLAKVIAQHELYQSVHAVPGAIVECGVFKGASFLRWAKFRHMYRQEGQKPLIGFDTFDRFPATEFEPDKEEREMFIHKAGDKSISREHLLEVLGHHRMAQNVELVAGDIRESIPVYLEKNADLKISLLLVDVDVYEPTRAALQYLFPRISPGGVVVLDDYHAFPGARKAVDEYFASTDQKIEELTISPKAVFVRKKSYDHCNTSS